MQFTHADVKKDTTPTQFDSWKRIWNMHKTRYCKVQYKLKMAEWYNLNDHAVRSGARPNPRTLRERVLNPYPTRVHKEEVHVSACRNKREINRQTDVQQHTHKQWNPSIPVALALRGAPAPIEDRVPFNVKIV